MVTYLASSTTAMALHFWILMLPLLLLTAASVAFALEHEFDIREHMSSTTRYDVSRKAANKILPNEDPVPPAGCKAIHLNLVARHGTRAPTKKRLHEFMELEDRLASLFASSNNGGVPAWLLKWRSTWNGKVVGGELTVEGEEEMFGLGERLRERFPDLFEQSYHPSIYPILATQVPRASASAVAFGLGLFAGKGSLGLGRNRAFAVTSDSRAYDIHLRFHETCHNYKEAKASRKPFVAKWQGDVYTKVAGTISERLNISFTSSDISSLWLLCKQEASILEIRDQACGLFTTEEVMLLEWADDVELHHLKGYGESINYRMGITLLENVIEAMDLAIEGNKGNTTAWSLEKGRFRFAHAETVIPFTCLLGLFLDKADMKTIQQEKPLANPVKPPLPRLWRGSIVAPFAANTLLVLYKCPSDKQNVKEAKYLVQVLHNERPVTMPACKEEHFCPVELFKEGVAASHLKHSFNGLCMPECNSKKLSWTAWLYKQLGYGPQKCNSRNSYDKNGLDNNSDL